MAQPAIAWISVAVGAAIGALLGFRDGRPTEQTARPVAHQPAARAIESPKQAILPPPAPVQTPATPAAAEASSTVLVSTPAEPTKPPREAPPKPKPRPSAPPVAVAQTLPGGASGTEELTDPRAIFRAESACARKDPVQCLRASHAFRIGVATKPNPKTASIYWHSAFRIYEERCKKRDPLACIGLAAMYEKGPGKQPTFAPDLMQHARGICEQRHQEQCDRIDEETESLRTLLLNVEAPPVTTE